MAPSWDDSTEKLLKALERKSTPKTTRSRKMKKASIDQLVKEPSEFAVQRATEEIKFVMAEYKKFKDAIDNLPMKLELEQELTTLEVEMELTNAIVTGLMGETLKNDEEHRLEVERRRAQILSNIYMAYRPTTETGEEHGQD